MAESKRRLAEAPARVSDNPVLKALQDARQKLAATIEGRFSVYANTTLLWEDRSKHIPSEIKETDPLSVQFCKHVLLAMQDAERLLIMIQKLSETGFMPRAGENITELYELSKLFFRGFLKHLGELSKIAKQANISETALAPLRRVQSAFSGFAFESMTGEAMLKNIQERLGHNSDVLNEAMGGLVESFLSYHAVAPAPVEPERKYQFPPGAKIPEPTPGLHDEREWLGVLIDPVRDVTSRVAFLSNMLSRYIVEAEAKGEKFDAAEKALIEKTSKALAESKINKEGYYLYSEHETPLSQGLKGIFNMIWAINELRRGYTKGSYRKLVGHGRKALAHLQSIDWAGMGGNLKEVINQLINSMLIQGKEMVFPALSELTQNIHEQELQHHLRFGALLDEVRPFFGEVEEVYLARGIPVTNPLGAIKEEKRVLEEKVKPLRESESKVNSQSSEVNKLSILLKKYQKLGNMLGGKEKEVLGKAAAGYFYYKVPIAAWPSFIGGIGQIYDTFVSDMIIKPGMALVESAATGVVSIAEIVKRSYEEFPREQLLEALVEARESGALKEEDFPDWSDVQNRLVGELTTKQKQAFLEKIKKEKISVDGRLSDHWGSLVEKLEASIKQDRENAKQDARRSYKSRMVRNAFNWVTSGVSKIWEGWPPPGLARLVAVVEKRNVDLAEQKHAFQSYTEGIEAHEKISLEFAVHALESKGLVHFLRATEISVGAGDAKINRAEKRILAVILADFNHEDRAGYLRDADTKAREFVENPRQIQNLIKQLHGSKDPKQKALSHALAMELTLAGYVNVKDWEIPGILKAPDANVIYQDLNHVFDRLEVDQVLSMLNKASAGDEKACQRFALFKLLLTEKVLPNEKLEKGIDEAAALRPTKEEWVKLLVDHYKSLEKQFREKQAAGQSGSSELEQMNKIGLFLGRLARVDEKIADIVFKKTEARDILYHECVEAKTDKVIRSDKALYYESLVHTFVFETKSAETLPYSDFLEANKNVVLGIYKAMHPRETKSDEEIIRQYKSHAWELCELIEGFIAKYVSAGSLAENKLRQFFSGVTLCLGDESRIARQKILENQEEAKGSLQAKYIKLITPEDSSKFWERAKEDLVLKPQQKLFERIHALFDPLIASTGNKKIKKEIKKYVAEQKKVLANLSKALSKKSDLIVGSRYARQQMELIQELVEEKSREWAAQIMHGNTLEKLKENLFREIEIKSADLHRHTQEFERPANNKFELIIEAQKKVVQEALSEFYSEGIDVDEAKQKIELAEKALNAAHHVWVKEIKEVNEIEQLKTELFGYFEDSVKTIHAVAKEQGLEEKSYSGLVSDIEIEKKKVQQAVAKCYDGSSDFETTKKIIEESRKKVNDTCGAWKKERVALKDIDHLKKHLTNIIKILKEYLAKRKNSASMMAMFGRDFRQKKVKLVEKYVELFEKENKLLADAKPEDSKARAEAVCKLAAELDSDHVRLFADARREQNKKDKLSQNVVKIQQLTSSSDERKDGELSPKVPGSVVAIQRLLPLDEKRSKKRESKLGVREVKVDASDDLGHRVKKISMIASLIRKLSNVFSKPKVPNVGKKQLRDKS